VGNRRSTKATVASADALWKSEAQKSALKEHYATVAGGQLKEHYATVAGGQLKEH
jgi:hypothetical protein